MSKSDTERALIDAAIRINSLKSMPGLRLAISEYFAAGLPMEGLVGVALNRANLIGWREAVDE